MIELEGVVALEVLRVHPFQHHLPATRQQVCEKSPASTVEELYTHKRDLYNIYIPIKEPYITIKEPNIPIPSSTIRQLHVTDSTNGVKGVCGSVASGCARCE